MGLRVYDLCESGDAAALKTLLSRTSAENAREAAAYKLEVSCSESN